MRKKWSSVYYSFFKDDVKVKYTKDKDERKYHEFTCLHPNCGATIKRYLDKKDATSTGSLKYHVEESCKAWGPGISDVVKSAKEAQSVGDGRAIAGSYIRTGNITHVFQRKDKATVTYSIRNHTFDEIRSGNPRSLLSKASANPSLGPSSSAGYARASNLQTSSTTVDFEAS
jgi:hypothetical protein